MKACALGLLLTFWLAGNLAAGAGPVTEDVTFSPREFQLPATMFLGRESKLDIAAPIQSSISDQPLVDRLPAHSERDGLYAIGGLLFLGAALILGACQLVPSSRQQRDARQPQEPFA